MATTKQKEAARKNIAKARQAKSSSAKGKSSSAKGSKASRSEGLSTAEKDRVPAKHFAFPKERKEPLVDARHVRNAVSRFDQVEGVTDKERDAAWKRIQSAAKKFDVDIKAHNWRELFKGGKAKKKS